MCSAGLAGVPWEDTTPRLVHIAAWPLKAWCLKPLAAVCCGSCLETDLVVPYFG